MKSTSEMMVGVDYYPEHWDESMWSVDAQRMRASHISMVRLAEFAWSRLEPSLGQYDFAWLDRAIDTLGAQGLKIVLGTPTATPPNWLVEQCPDVLPVDAKGQVMQPGVRWHRCYNSPSLNLYGEAIIGRMAKHYAKHPAVIGWQTDNEMVANDCHCDNCTFGFRNWVARKYGTLEELNRAWGTVVWSGEYSNWSQLKTPLGGSPHLNPSMLLDFQRFSSDSVAAFNKRQADLLRKHCPDHFVTHNVWGYPVTSDYYQLFESMDFASVDYYPATDLKNDAKANIYLGALTHDLTRGIKQANFWVMEQLSGTPGCWHPMSRTPRPGMIRAHAWQSVSRGADVIVHFRWRSARVGAEQFWHGLHDHHGQPGRRYQEFLQFSTEFTELAPLLQGTTVRNEVALLFSHEQLNALRIQPQSDGFDYLANFKQLHKAFLRMGVGTDVLNWTHDELSSYRLIVAPSMYLESAAVVQRLHSFVTGGGILVLTPRTGVKNLDNVCQTLRLPGLLSTMAGVEVDEYDPVGRDVQRVVGEQGLNCGAHQWCDVLQPTSAMAVAHYDSEFFAGRVAITRNMLGQGEVYYMGTVLDDAGTQHFFRTLAERVGLAFTDNLPEGIELSRREGNGKRLLFVLNLSAHDYEFKLNPGLRRHALSKAKADQSIHLPAMDALVLEEL
jgi:beta-galactosidase